MLILLISNLIVKVVGVMFKIPLVGIMGDEGMGYFNSAYTVYTLFYTVSSSGLPLALSILISRCDTEGRQGDKARVYSAALCLFAVMGGFFTLVMFLGSGALGEIIGNPSAAPSILAISPVMLFICITSAVRGYFQGHQNMIPTAVSQMVEAMGKLVFGILFSLYAVKKGYSFPVVAAYSILGITLSEALCMLCLLLFRKNKSVRDGYTMRRRDAIAGIVKTALPITISSAVVSLSGLLDLMIVMNRLTSIGYSAEMANALFGNYTGLAMPLFNLPASLITPISLGIVPYITSALALNDGELAVKTVRSSIKSTMIIAFPCAFGLSALSEPILKLIFDDAQAQRAAENLALLALATVGVAMTSVTSAILQSYGHRMFPILSMTAGCAVKLISGYFLIGELGMTGTPISTGLCYGVTSVLNLWYIYVKIGRAMEPWRGFFKPMICGALSAAAGYFAHGYMEGRIQASLACVLAIGFAGGLYLLLGAVFSLVDIEDTKVFPGGKYIEKLIAKK